MILAMMAHQFPWMTNLENPPKGVLAGSIALLAGSLFSTLALASPARSQIIPDSTLDPLNPARNSQVQFTGHTWNITGGTPAGSSLFHSFETFRLEAGETAFFNHDSAIGQIFARITGNQGAWINGTLRANGNASLFLLSPQGIAFGSGANLQLGGSFVATTAHRVIFQTGEFNALRPNTPPLLTINPPVGFGFDAGFGDPAGITLQGGGHQLVSQSAIAPLYLGNPPAGSLAVAPGRSLVLLGGAVTLEGAGAIASQGQMTVGSVAGGTVGLTSVPSALGLPRLTLDYGGATGFRDITLGNLSVMDVSAPPAGFGGVQPGAIQIQGRSLTVAGGSAVMSQNFAAGAAGSVAVTLSDRLTVTGTDPRSGGILRSAILSNSVGGNGAPMTIQAGDITVEDGGAIASINLGPGIGGDIQIQGQDLSLNGVSRFTGETNSALAAQTLGTGPSGNITVDVQNLSLRDGGIVVSNSFGLGHGGNITINAQESVTLSGYDPQLRISSIISPATFSRGDAGSVQLTTDRLSLFNGGQISSATFAQGNAGNLRITARDILLQGNDTGLENQTTIASDGGLLPLVNQIRFGVTAPSGRSGDVQIQSQSLTLTNNARLSVNNLGSGSGGTLTIATQTLLLQGSTITAETQSGEGGNFNIRADRGIFLRQGSAITTEARGTGNGGNMTLTTPLLVGLPQENSDIIANAFAGNGGNIQINANSILGLQLQPTLTPRSDITASSQLGVSGTINLNRPEADVSSGLAQLPTTLADPSQEIRDSCAASGNQLTATGRGGLPENPLDLLRSPSLWPTIPLSSSRASSPYASLDIPVDLPITSPQDTPSPRPLEAQGWHTTPLGQVQLLAQVPAPVPTPSSPPENSPQDPPGASPPPLAQTLNQIQTLRIQGQYRQALALVQPLAQDPALPPLAQAIALRSQGVLQHLTGDLLAAKTSLEQSWTIAQQLPPELSPLEESQTLLELGNLARDFQVMDAALAYYQAAQHLGNSLEDPQGTGAIVALQAQLNELSLWIALQEWPQAEALVAPLVQRLETLPPQPATLAAALNLSESLQELALSHPNPGSLGLDLGVAIDRTLTLATTQAQHLSATPSRLQAQILSQQAQWLRLQGNPTQALALSRQSLQLAQQIHATDLEARHATQLGQLYQDLGQPQAALSTYTVAYQALQTLRSDLAALNPDLQLSFRQNVEPVYRQLVSLLLATANTAPDPQPYLRQALGVIESLQLAELDNFFRDACLQVRPTDLNEIDPQATVIYPIILDDRLEVIMASPHQPLQHYSPPVDRATLAATLGQLYSSLHPGYPKDLHLQAAQQVYDWIIRPGEAQLNRVQPKTLVFILDGMLKNIPMAVLHDGQGYLVERYALALSPGLQLLPPAPIAKFLPLDSPNLAKGSPPYPPSARNSRTSPTPCPDPSSSTSNSPAAP